MSHYPPELARADRLLSADELQLKYGTVLHNFEHPRFQQRDWRHAVSMSSTTRGYWDWVQAQLEEDEP